MNSGIGTRLSRHCQLSKVDLFTCYLFYNRAVNVPHSLLKVRDYVRIGQSCATLPRARARGGTAWQLEPTAFAAVNDVVLTAHTRPRYTTQGQWRRGSEGSL